MIEGLDALQDAIWLEDSFITAIRLGRGEITFEGDMLCLASTRDAGERVWRKGFVRIAGVRQALVKIKDFLNVDANNDLDFGYLFIYEDGQEVGIDMGIGELRLQVDAPSVAFELGEALPAEA